MMALGDVAATLGYPVFPCAADKRPVIATGFKAATRDMPTILAAFARPGAELIGMPTGSLSGLIAIDVDIRETRTGMPWLDENREALPQTRTHRTRSGGLHLLFRQPDGVEIRNSAGLIAPGVDVRGSGGYIIVPPSPGYAVADPTPPAEMPRWLIRACTKPETAPAPQTAPAPRERMERYAEAALDGEVAAVVRAAEGTRNDRLNVAAVKLGGLIASGALARSTVEAELRQAARTSGLDGREIEATIKSGIDFGMQSPRSAPERSRTADGVAPVAAHPDKQPADAILRKDGSVLPIQFFSDITHNTDIADFVEGLLVSSVMSVVYGESNSGKTFFASDLALHVAAGWTWNGREVDRCGVLYCALEGSHGIRNRVAAFRTNYGLDDHELPFAVIPCSLNLLDPDTDVAILVAAVKYVSSRMNLKVGLVVIDTLSRAMAGGNENAPDDMGALVMNGDTIREQTGAHVLWVHHSGKDQAKGARGHSLLRAATDTEIEITAEGPQRLARVTKQRDLECTGEFAFTLKVVELGHNRRKKPVTSCVVDYGDSAALGRGHAAGAASARRHLTGHNKRALEVLIDLCAASGQAGYVGTPSGMLSVPEKWWRERFYERAMPGEKEDTKKKAFTRASGALINQKLVGMNNHRVWFVAHRTTESSDEQVKQDVP